mmetsp:Transcript_6773/g.8069  ORF Transcript_6773/g.8069 Transcript_6773/m.8069 type:complete len:93 (+) Transcript_6773:99-377(+)
MHRDIASDFTKPLLTAIEVVTDGSRCEDKGMIDIFEYVVNVRSPEGITYSESLRTFPKDVRVCGRWDGESILEAKCDGSVRNHKCFTLDGNT